jgi:hypothetical protein
MLIAIQYPLPDFRQFVEDSGRLPLPSWPVPRVRAHFVRSLGGIEHRKLGGLEGWVGEEKLCEAGNAFRFSQSLCFHDRSSSFQFPLRCQYRRFFSDGLAVSKFEVGLVSTRPGSIDLGAAEATNVLKHCLTQRVEVRGSGGDASPCKLIEAGAALARLCRRASTETTKQNHAQEWWVQAGTPIVMLQYSGREKVALPDFWIRRLRLTSDLGFDLSRCLVEYPGGSVPMWMMGPVWFHEAANARLLRLYLMRLHAELECLAAVFREILSGRLAAQRGTPLANKLQEFLSRKIKRIRKLESKAEKRFHGEIPELARHLTSAMHPGELEGIEETLGTLGWRPNLIKSVRNHSEARQGPITIEKVETMNVDAGDKINAVGSVIATRGSHVDHVVISLKEKGKADVAGAISTLHAAIVGAPDAQLTEQEKKQAMELLSELGKHAGEVQPSKTILRTLGEGLLTIIEKVKPFAQAVGEAIAIIKGLWV